MKALISLREKDIGWVRETLGRFHPGMLPIANKPQVEYLIDFAILNGCSDVRIVMDELGRDLENYFGNGIRWGVRISYALSSCSDNIEQVIEKNSNFCADSSLLIMDGFFFIHYDKNKAYDIRAEILSQAMAVSCESGSVFYCSNIKELSSMIDIATEVDFSLSPLNSMDDVFQMTVQILDAEQEHYVLPGYGSAKEVLMGRNVELERNVQIRPPVIIGNNVRLGKNAIIGPHAAIGNDSVVDQETEVKESIVFPKSYLGVCLTLQKKIICGDKMFSVKEGEWLEIGEGFLLSQLNDLRIRPFFRKLVDRSAAFLLILLLFLPFYFLRTARLFQNDWIIRNKKYFRNAQGQHCQVKEVVPSCGTRSGRVFEKLSLDCFYKLFSAAAGKLDLVGNQPLEVNMYNMRRLQDFTFYSAGVFTYSKSEGLVLGSLEADITERFYAANKSILQDGRVLTRIMHSRFTVKNMEVEK